MNGPDFYKGMDDVNPLFKQFGDAMDYSFLEKDDEELRLEAFIRWTGREPNDLELAVLSQFTPSDLNRIIDLSADKVSNHRQYLAKCLHRKWYNL